MTAQRLYMAVHVSGADENYDVEFWGEPLSEPAGWAEFCQEKWGEYKPFFWPKTGVPYRSRSSAQHRVDIINRWGGNAVVMECTPVWQTVAEAKADRERVRLQERMDRLHVELAEVQARFASKVTP